MKKENIPLLPLKEIKCSDCGNSTNHKNQYGEGICERCHQEQLEISNEIRQHELNLKSQNYLGFPEAIPTPEFIPIKIDEIIKQRGNEFLIIK